LPTFLRLCADLAPYSYGQNFHDVFALWAAGMRRTGWFVEFGALGGINVSNSYLLERLGWSGVVAEPHPGFQDQLRANRRCHVSTECVWTATGKTVTFQAVRGRPALSTIAGLDYDDVQSRSGARDDHVLHDVPTISLVDLLRSSDAPVEIDLCRLTQRALSFRSCRPLIFPPIDLVPSWSNTAIHRSGCRSIGS
jgi:hypothetical protein